MSLETALQGPGRIALVGFGILVVPQVAGLIANRAFSRWMPLARTVGAVVPFMLAIALWSALADYDDQARLAAGLKLGVNHTGVMSGFLMLPPLHLIVALAAQSALRYGKGHRVQ